jgi:hypothetical protein
VDTSTDERLVRAGELGRSADGDETPDRKLWRTLTQKKVLDFSRWKTKAFGPEFDKLLDGIKKWYKRQKD